MLKHLFAAAAFTCCLAAPAGAQNETALPAVDSMDCTQMTAEMTTAGMQMNSQLDREGLQADNEAAQADMARRQREAQTGAVGAGVICAIPGAGMACAAAQQAQMERAMQGVPEAQARQQRQIDRIESSMAGIDQNRMMAISERFEAQHCQMPQ